VVYVKGSNISIKYRIRNRSGNLLHVTFKFEDPQYVRANFPNQPISLGGAGTQTFELAAGATHDVTVTVTGMPGYVTYGELKAKINLESENGGIHSDGPSDLEQVFLTDSQPLAPISVPWIEVLLDACSWADGQSGAEDCTYYCTFGLYWSTAFAYHGQNPSYIQMLSFSSERYLLSKLFQNRYAPPGQVSGDCQDVSGYLFLSTGAIGVSLSTQQQWPELGPMRTNEICPIGSDGSNQLYYDPTLWNFHQICIRSGLAYDACAAQIYDPAGNAYMNPPAGWTISAFWQTPNPNWGQPGNTKPQYFGLVDGYDGQPSGPIDRSPNDISIIEVQ
jgi:hypothetical protein